MVSERHYTPGPASHEGLVAHMARLGVQRVVIVQPSVYGTDNRCMLNSLDRLHGLARGVAVVDEKIQEDTLRSMHARGVRGLRVNMESAGLRDADTALAVLARWAERIANLGWHLQLYAAFDITTALAEDLARISVPLVLDHFAMVPAAVAADDPRVTALLALLRSGNAYIKLSAPYRLASGDEQANDAVGAWAATIRRVAPDRMLWGSDWPHTARDPEKTAHEVSGYRALPDGELAASLRAWLPTARLMEQVLVENPARLYRF